MSSRPDDASALDGLIRHAQSRGSVPGALDDQPTPPGQPTPAPAESVWAASSRAVVGPASADLRACVSCGLALAAAARFCRRCGASQTGAPRPPVASGTGRRRSLPLRAVALAALALVATIGLTPWTGGVARAGGPKVVFIVGPVGDLTSEYRAYAEAGVAQARTFTDNIVRVYSPNATWPAARAALEGASLVVYLGHGNGFPSPYSAALVPDAQDGLGLNPLAGVDDTAHQYFGERYLASEVHLAPHAVVLLHHLCYASGNSEPGLPEGSLATSEARVDNMAAGWAAAGAEAVLADAAFGPAYYVRAILGGSSTIESIWRSAPSFHGHVLGFASRRTPGLSALLDPTYPGHVYHRSLVARMSLRPSELLAGATGVTPGAGAVPAAAAGPVAAGASITGAPVAGTQVSVSVGLAPASSAAPGLELGLRWNPLATDPGATAPSPSPASAAVASPTASPSAKPATGGAASPQAIPAAKNTAPANASAPENHAAPPKPAAGGTPGARSSAPAGPGPSAAPTVVLVQPEVIGDLVLLAKTNATKNTLSASTRVPARPGLYRLVISLHDADGVAFDSATQAQVPALIVRVSSPLSGTILAPASLAAETGAAISLPLTIANTGSLAWQETPMPAALDGGPTAESARPSITARWVRLDTGGDAADVPVTQPVERLAPGASSAATLALTAPAEPGAYLLVLDVVSPIYGSLTAAGSAPTTVRVTVAAPVAPALDAAS